MANSGAHSVSVLPNIAESGITLESTRVTFPAQPEGTVSTARTVTVSSTGEWPLRVHSVKTTGGAPDDFIVTRDTCSGEVVAVGATCTVAVRFAPQRQGPRRASQQIASDAASPLVEVALGGTGGEAPTGDRSRRRVRSRRPERIAPPATTVADNERLVAAFAADRYRVKRGRRLRLRYINTDAARVTVEVRRGRRLITRTTRTATAGANALAVRAPRARGRYTLKLTAAAGTRRASDKAGLTVS